MKTFALALFSTLLSLSNAGYWEAGPCPPKPPVVTPFDTERYLGNWYAQWETPMPYATEDNTCTGYQYGARGENDINLYIISTLRDGRISDVCGWLEPVDSENPTGDLYIHMGSAVDPGWILDTDYDSFSVTYSCENHPLELSHKKTASIDTRDPNPSQETIDKAFEVFESNGLIFDDWYPIAHSDDCVYDRSPSCKDNWE